jgi:DNA-directed RNA polymerase subunit RPC12/RpoP
MSDLSEFTELKNDGACDGLPSDQNPRFDITCPECSSTKVDWDMKKGCYVCSNCGQEFQTERFVLDD